MVGIWQIEPMVRLNKPRRFDPNAPPPELMPPRDGGAIAQVRTTSTEHLACRTIVDAFEPSR